MFKIIAAIANVKYIIESITNAYKAISTWWKNRQAAKRDKAYQDRIDARTQVGQDIAVEAKNEPTEESDEALRNHHRKM